MSDYTAHARRAEEVLDELERKTKGRLGPESMIRVAQVQAILALAAAINGRDGDRAQGGQVS
ncbi:hypothetical protein AMK31_00040 [Streptomyces sp. TSRI0107]|nr:hypothetical protein AMK31_00040 [Streptomyces sp. TSRI0107]